jgi:hypothetical protein
VTQEEHQPLLVGQSSDGSTEIAAVDRVAVHRWFVPTNRCACHPPQLDAADVDERPPQPRLETIEPTQVFARPDRACKRFLHSIVSSLAISEHRDGNSQKAAITIAIYLLDRCQLVAGFSPHLP